MQSYYFSPFFAHSRAVFSISIVGFPENVNEKRNRSFMLTKQEKYATLTTVIKKLIIRMNEASIEDIKEIISNAKLELKDSKILIISSHSYLTIKYRTLRVQLYPDSYNNKNWTQDQQAESTCYDIK